MADVLRIVTFSPGGRPVEVLNLNSEPGATTAYFRERDGGFQFVPGVPTVQYSRKVTRHGGAYAVGEHHDNGSIGWTAYVRGETLLAATQNVEALLVAINETSRGRYIEWAPEGGPSSFVEIAGPGSWTPAYNPVEFVQTNAMRVQLVFPTLPLVRWMRMDVSDPFDVDSTADYAYDSLTAANTVVAGGVVTASGGSLTTERRVRHTARGYDLFEGQATLKSTPVTTITGYKFGVTLRATSATDYVEVYIDDNGTNSRLRIDVVIGGVRTNRATSNLGARLVTGIPAWVRGRIEGDTVYAEHFLLQSPRPMLTPTTTTSYALISGDAPLNTTAGKAGWSWVPQDATATLDDFVWEPYTYRNRQLPDTFEPTDPIPGTINALVDVTVTSSGGAEIPIWALVGWTPRPLPYSLIQNGNFESDTPGVTPFGWQATAITGMTGAATSCFAQNAAGVAKFGNEYAEVTCPATSNTGAGVRIPGKFTKGVPYTAEMWVRAPSATTTLVVRLGAGPVGDSQAGTVTALTSTWTLRTTTWTPTADREEVYLTASIQAATATVFHIDGARVYRGTAAPTEIAGFGAYPPFGLIEAEAGHDLVGWAVTTTASTRGGRELRDAAVAGSELYEAWYRIDPTSLAADDFSAGELVVEIWARLLIDPLNVNPRIYINVIGGDGFSYGPVRATNEWGEQGSVLIKPSAATYRFCRLGTINLPADRLNRRTMLFGFLATTDAGSTGVFGVDYIMLLPARSRALLPTAKSYGSGYPVFTQSTAETSRTIRSDLSGLTADPPNPPIADHGMGGSLIEPPPGAVDWIVKLSNLVPDEPSGDGSIVEQLAHAGTFHLHVTPRSYILRNA